MTPDSWGGLGSQDDGLPSNRTAGPRDTPRLIFLGGRVLQKMNYFGVQNRSG